MRKFLCPLQALLLYSLIVSTQGGKLSNCSTDDAGSSIPFASIRVRGNCSGISVDAQANFQIDVNNGSVLIVSAVNYARRELPAGTGETLVVTLSKGEGLIDEAIVTALGMRPKPRELGYSLTKVNNQDITVARSSQLAQGLSKKVSGLAIFNVNNSVDPAVKIAGRTLEAGPNRSYRQWREC